MVSLLLQVFVLEAVEAGGPFFDFLEAWVGAVAGGVAVVAETVGGGVVGSGGGGVGSAGGEGVGGDEGGVGGVAFGGAFGGDL